MRDKTNQPGIEIRDENGEHLQRLESYSTIDTPKPDGALINFLKKIFPNIMTMARIAMPEHSTALKLINTVQIPLIWLLGQRPSLSKISQFGQSVTLGGFAVKALTSPKSAPNMSIAGALVNFGGSLTALVRFLYLHNQLPKKIDALRMEIQFTEACLREITVECDQLEKHIPTRADYETIATQIESLKSKRAVLESILETMEHDYTYLVRRNEKKISNMTSNIADRGVTITLAGCTLAGSIIILSASAMGTDILLLSTLSGVGYTVARNGRNWINMLQSGVLGLIDYFRSTPSFCLEDMSQEVHIEEIEEEDDYLNIVRQFAALPPPSKLLEACNDNITTLDLGCEDNHFVLVHNNDVPEHMEEEPSLSPRL